MYIKVTFYSIIYKNMVNITTENYKAEMLLTSIRELGKQKGLGYRNLIALSRLTSKLEEIMKPYLETRREIIQKYSKKDEKTGQFIVAPESQDETMKELEDIAQATVSFDAEPIVLVVEDDSFLDFNTINAFVSALGEENFKVERPADKQ